MLSIQWFTEACGRWRLAVVVTAVGAAAAAACDGGLEPAPFVGIQGVATLQGTPPDQTHWLRLIVLRELPASAEEFDVPWVIKNLAAFTEPLPLEAAAVPFHIPLPPGEYAWLLAVWKELGPLDATTVREAGTYYGPNDPADGPAAFQVAPGRETPDLDLTVNFDAMRSLDEIFPPESPGEP